MKLRSLLALGTLAATSIVGACSEQKAGSFVGLDEFTSGTVRVRIETDTANSTTTPKLIAAPNTFRVGIFRPGETTALRTVNTAGGFATFVGLEPGTYIVRPVARAGSVFSTQAEDTVELTAVGDTVVADTLRLRLGTRLVGFIASQYYAGDPDTARQVTNRFPGVEVRFYRETATAGVFETAPFVVDTTDATGTFDVALTPGPLRVRIQFNSDTAPLARLRGGSADSLMFRGAGTPPAVRGIESDIVTGLDPNRDVTRNEIYSFLSNIRVAACRDLNNNGTCEFTGENLVTGASADVIRLQLATFTVTGADTAFRTISANTTNLTSSTVTTLFSSVKPGTYALLLDVGNSRFPSDPNALRRGKYVIVTVPNSAASVTVNFPVPFGG